MSSHFTIYRLFTGNQTKASKIFGAKIEGYLAEIFIVLQFWGQYNYCMLF